MTLSRNFWDLVNFPKQVPGATRLSRGTLAASFSSFSLRGRSRAGWAGAGPGTAGCPIPGTARASPQVVHAVPVQAEAVGAIGPVHQQLDVLADAAGTEP